MPVVDTVALKARLRRGASLLLLGAALALAGCSESSRPPERVTILADPGRFGSVAHAAAAAVSVDWWDGRDDDDRACTESFAAAELARFLPASFGIDAGHVATAEAGRLPEKGDVIVVGASAARAAGLPAPEPSAKAPDAFRISTSRREGRTILVITGRSRTGTLAGAYGLLERLGVRFYDLGDSGAVMPAVPGRLTAKLRADEAPGFTTRGFWAWEPRGSNDFFLWMARNRMNLWTAAEPRAAFLEKLGIRLTAGGHSIQSDFLDPNGRAPGETRTRFQLHPEWYGLENGRRTPGISGESGLNFCTSNAAAVAELAGGLTASIRNGPMRHADVVQLWPLDGGRWCQCDSCRAIGSPQDRWLRVVAEVKRRLAGIGRTVTLVSPAYLETSEAPTRPVDPGLEGAGSLVSFFPYFRCYAHALADPACGIVNAPIESRLRGWTDGTRRPYQGELAIGEYYNVSWTKSLPFVHPHVMAADLRDWELSGIRHFTTMHAPTRLWGTWTFEHAMLARLLWNPRANADSLIGDFCAREYGEAGGDLRTFYRALELAVASSSAR